MPTHIKHMDKMLKISVIWNTPLSQLFVGTSFIAQNFILKKVKISLSRVELPQHLNNRGQVCRLPVFHNN